MNAIAITDADRELIACAKDLIRRRYREGYHHLAAAVRTTAGEVVLGLHVEANIGRITICAEGIALGSALTQGKDRLDTIVTVWRAEGPAELYSVVSPCGMCRELLNDYMPQGFCILAEEGQLRKVKVDELLPGKYVRDSAVLA